MNFIAINGRKVEALIFDFDGTLAELNIDFMRMRAGVEELLGCYGLDHKISGQKFVLERIEDAGTVLAKESKSKASSFRRDALQLIQEIEMEAASCGSLFAATRAMFVRLQKHYISTGIITRNCALAVKTIFPDILDYCPVVICRDDVRRVKPHPEQINLAVSRLGKSAARSLMVGDHPLDIQTGKNAGAMSAGVLSGHFQKQDFLDAGADLVLRQAADIITFL